VNDSAALAAASVGIAVRGGAEASLAAADVSLAREGLLPITELMHGARGTMRAIHATIVASLFYNVIAAGLSMAGLISPLLAAIIMPASSLTVLGIAWSSRAFVAKEVSR
jgi:Cu2+-exporting ATPase